VLLVLKIKQLLYERKYTIEGARQHLKKKSGTSLKLVAALPDIPEIRAELISYSGPDRFPEKMTAEASRECDHGTVILTVVPDPLAGDQSNRFNPILSGQRPGALPWGLDRKILTGHQFCLN
jgi:hypothetical protein